ncbi:hypothetical protein E1212_04110 [Jiangella ureilytica]|uniref:N,N-dimethylformamidase beta subunit-like C-terminal domain-containing protein n=1 Tax=Jiangella ureilytica TaxID=2530374 RepID=A0A4R4RV86_9ACTN|nr:N,N-dimethylformamidase beta subunit family domain-containing protein [Jiangella ureilytica]TDC53980.1 hypothetical protein E1212_04110 [Jiangella ureilytica]
MAASYLGGNGFYWFVGLDPEEGHTIEVRRCGASTRAWESEPGEWHLSTTGDLGGLWRMRGRPPQALLGVGFTAQGQGPGRPYARQPDSRSERATFIFAGVEDEMIGNFSNAVNAFGAAGFEIDRVDHDLGTPAHALVIVAPPASPTDFCTRWTTCS